MNGKCMVPRLTCTFAVQFIRAVGKNRVFCYSIILHAHNECPDLYCITSGKYIFISP